MQDFILHWGDMGAKWGVNRSVAQIHALLHIAPDPVDAEAAIALIEDFVNSQLASARLQEKVP